MSIFKRNNNSSFFYAIMQLIEHTHLQAGVLFGAGFIDLLDYLKGEYDIADFVGFAVPDKLYFAFITKKQKTVFIGQGFISFQIADYFLLFLFGKPRHFYPSIL